MRRSVFFILLFTSCYSCTSGQNKIIDSLTALIKIDKEDTNKVNHLNQLGRIYIYTAGKDTEYCVQAVNLAKKSGFTKGVADGYRNIATAYWACIKDNPRALEYFSMAGELYKATGNLTEEVKVAHLTGYVYYGMDSFATALKYGFKAKKLNEKARSKYFMVAIPTNMGDYYNALGDYPNALQNYLEALRAIKESGDDKRTSMCLLNIGTFYLKINDFKNAMNYFDSALTLGTKIKYKPIQIEALLQIGITYKTEKRYTEALEYENKVLELNGGNISQIDIARCSEVIGEIYKEQGNYDEALNYEKKALKLGEENKFPPVTIQSRGVIGEIYLKQKNYKEAATYLLAAIASVHGSHELEAEKNYELDLSQLYAATGELKKSLEYYTKYDSIKDSLINRDKSRQIGRIEAKSEYDRQLAAQQAEEAQAKAIADAKSKRQEIINLLIILIAVIIALIAILIYRSLRAAKREKIEVEKEKILMELKALRAQMNPHFIFNAINSIQNFILENDQDAAQKHLSRFSKLMRMVLENSSYENIPLSDEIKMLELYLEFETVRFSSKFKYKITIDDSIDIDNTFIPPLILQPYVENAIRHGLMYLKGKQGEVTIQVEKSENRLKCTVDDNGIGRAGSMEIKKGSLHKSMGLSITAERLEIINTLFKSKMSVNFTDKINADGTPGGTKVELLMPLIENVKAHA